MKKFLKFTLLLCVLSLSTQAADIQKELENTTALQTQLEQKGINNLIDDVQKNGWSMPYIPSQWHVEHVSKPEQKALDVASREFGKELVKQLADIAATMQKLPDNEELYRQTLHLCNLSDWCASVEGYGNVFLAQRALDIAAVGVARLSANLDFPLEKTNELLSRMQPSWMGLETRRRILNKDAETNIYPVAEVEDMDQTWVSGKVLLEEGRDPNRKQLRPTYSPTFHLRETKELLQNLTLFDETEVGQIKPAVTLATTWDLNWHRRLIAGLELQSIRKAKALAEFRSVIKYFPDETIFSAAELKNIKRWSDDYLEKNKIKTVVTPEGNYDVIGKAAFSRAWRPTVVKVSGMSDNEWNQRLNMWVTAYQAYDEVKHGRFFDHDTANSQQYLAETKSTP